MDTHATNTQTDSPVLTQTHALGHWPSRPSLPPSLPAPHLEWAPWVALVRWSLASPGPQPLWAPVPTPKTVFKGGGRARAYRGGGFPRLPWRPPLSPNLPGPHQLLLLTWVPGAATLWLICSFRIVRASSWGSGLFTNTRPPSFLVGWTLSSSSQAQIPIIWALFLHTPIVMNGNPDKFSHQKLA